MNKRAAQVRSSPVLGFALLAPGLLFLLVVFTKFVLHVGVLYEALDAVAGGPTHPNANAAPPQFRGLRLFKSRHSRWSLGKSALGLLLQIGVVFGPPAALLLSLLSIVGVRVTREGGQPVVHVVMRLRPPHIVVIAASIVGVVALYTVVENLPCLVGRTVSC